MHYLGEEVFGEEVFLYDSGFLPMFMKIFFRTCLGHVEFTLV